MPEILNEENTKASTDSQDFHGYYDAALEETQQTQQEEILEEDDSSIDSNGNYITSGNSRINQDGTFATEESSVEEIPEEELPTLDRKKRKQNFSPSIFEAPKKIKRVDINTNLELENINLVNLYEAKVLEEIKRFSEKEKRIEARMQIGQLLHREMMKLKDDYDNETKTVSLDQYAELIEEYQKEHFTALQRDNKGVINEDQNPFPSNFNYENVTKDKLDQIIDLIESHIELDQTGLTKIARSLSKAMNEYQLAILPCTNMKSRDSDTMVKHMGEGR